MYNMPVEVKSQQAYFFGVVMSEEKRQSISGLMKNYGKELILDIHNCDTSKFNRKDLRKYLDELCELIDMEQDDLHWWDYEGVPDEERDTEPHLVGTSVVQFITTSDIVIHSLDILERIYINIFSCKDFDADVAAKFTRDFFSGQIVSRHVIDRV